MINEPAAWFICISVIAIAVVSIVLLTEIPHLIRAWRGEPDR